MHFNRYDAVTYLKYLDSLRASESFRSVWIFAESSYKIFEYAKKRVYHFGRSDSGKSVGLGKIASTKKRKLNEGNEDDDGEFCFLEYLFICECPVIALMRYLYLVPLSSKICKKNVQCCVG